MLDIKYIRENTEKVRKSIESRGMKVDLDALLQLDQERRAVIQETEEQKAKQNVLSKKVAQLMGQEKLQKIQESQKLKEGLVKVEKKAKTIEDKFYTLLKEVPNIVADDVPEGKDETENQVLRTVGRRTTFDFSVKDHVALGEELNLIDIESASRVTGTRFAYLKNEAVLLEFALVQFTLQTLTSSVVIKKIADSIAKGYRATPFVPVIPPVMIRPEIFLKMARLSEQDKEERYYLQKDDLYLIGSAEHTLGPLHMDETIEEKRLPIRYIGFSTAFRREAGSYGKDTKGILRVHQFDKLEMESFTVPEDSIKEQEFFIAIQEYLVRALKLPYQVVMLCTGDMGKPDARQVDIETWMPGQDRYRETHTADLLTDYQARRLNTRVKRKGGTTEFVHMNDATAFAIGRTLIAILENYQQKDGSVKIPAVLQKYVGKTEIKRPA